MSVGVRFLGETFVARVVHVGGVVLQFPSKPAIDNAVDANLQSEKSGFSSSALIALSRSASKLAAGYREEREARDTFAVVIERKEFRTAKPELVGRRAYCTAQFHRQLP